MLISESLSRLLPKELKQLKFETQLTFESSTLGVISVETLKCLTTCVDFSRSTRIFASFTIEMIGNET